MDCNPFSSTAAFTSRTETWQPAAAAICAIPEPIRPHPTTPTFSIDIDYSSEDFLRTAGLRCREDRMIHYLIAESHSRCSVNLRKDFLRQVKRGIGGRHSEIDGRLQQDFLNLLALNSIVQRSAQVHAKFVVAIQRDHHGEGD